MGSSDGALWLWILVTGRPSNACVETGATDRDRSNGCPTQTEDSGRPPAEGSDPPTYAYVDGYVDSEPTVERTSATSARAPVIDREAEHPILFPTTVHAERFATGALGTEAGFPQDTLRSTIFGEGAGFDPMESKRPEPDVEQLFHRLRCEALSPEGLAEPVGQLPVSMDPAEVTEPDPSDQTAAVGGHDGEVQPPTSEEVAPSADHESSSILLSIRVGDTQQPAGDLAVSQEGRVVGDVSTRGSFEA